MEGPFGRRRDLDAWCSRCMANGMDQAATSNLGIGRTIAFYRAGIKANRRLRIRPEPAVVVHHCNFHNCEVTPYAARVRA